MFGGALALVATGVTGAPLATGGGHVAELIREREQTTAVVGDDLVRGHGGGLLRGLRARSHRVHHCPTKWGMCNLNLRTRSARGRTRGGMLRPVPLLGADRAALDRRVRATHRGTREASIHKIRLRDIVRQLASMAPLHADLGVADLAVLERFADPSALLNAGRTRLTKLIAGASHHHQGSDRAEERGGAARAAASSMGSTRRSPSPNSPPRLRARCDCVEPLKENSSVTRRDGRARIGWSTPTSSPEAFGGSPPSALPLSSPRWVTRRALPTGPRSGPSPASPRARPRPATPITRASRCRRPAARSADDARPRRGHRRETRPSARRDLPDSDGRARQEPHRRALGRGSRARVCRHAHRDAPRGP